MKIKSKFLFIVLILSMVVVFPSTAFAQTDQYGYDAQARTFKGTLDNWEAFLEGTPPTTFSWEQKDTVFIERKWSKSFDPMVQGNPPSAPGAWQQVELWEYLSGDELGWTWHEELGIVYSPNRPIPGAVALTPEEMMFPGFYLIKDKEWSIGPNGEVTIDQDLSPNLRILKRLHKFFQIKRRSF
ncbi:hypothetical protein [Desulfosporosinus sp. OT]|uniref:hypothetical protein n=1 Tax=Desulfosporosinus sp. OT TaxID=913865 RepID=UPI000223A528|nr:hypothetical protein [Desulfosporosinus sp. OT]EGW41987.1 hypothetical protein DOT_0047 [Desulfosporosinus sp. OT]